jgi:hypothetical protein
MDAQTIGVYIEVLFASAFWLFALIVFCLGISRVLTKNYKGFNKK